MSASSPTAQLPTVESETPAKQWTMPKMPAIIRLNINQKDPPLSIRYLNIRRALIGLSIVAFISILVPGMRFWIALAPVLTSLILCYILSLQGVQRSFKKSRRLRLVIAGADAFMIVFYTVFISLFNMVSWGTRLEFKLSILAILALHVSLILGPGLDALLERSDDEQTASDSAAYERLLP